MSELCEGKCCRTGALRNLVCGASRTPKQPCFPAASKRVIVRIFFISPPPYSTTPTPFPQPALLATVVKHRRNPQLQRADRQVSAPWSSQLFWLSVAFSGCRTARLRPATPERLASAKKSWLCWTRSTRPSARWVPQNTRAHMYYVFHDLCYVCPLLENVCRSFAHDLPWRARKSKHASWYTWCTVFACDIHVLVTYYSWTLWCIWFYEASIQAFKG